MKQIFTLIVFLIIGPGITASAQYLQFVENKGQWDSSVSYRSSFGGGELYLGPAGYRVVLHNQDELKELAEFYGGHVHSEDKKGIINMNKRPSSSRQFTLHSHAYGINFLQADGSPVALPDKPEGLYNNYFVGSDSSKWRTGCRIFNGLTYKNVYKNVDIRYYSDNGNLKYDIIINPGADISKIALQFSGLDGLSINKYGNLVMKTSLGEVYQSIPSSYQLSKNQKSEVKVNFQLEGDIVKFKIGKYDKNSTLVIDPTLIFSTFVGSISDVWGYTATYDNAGNFYAGGIAFASGYDARRVGGYDQTFGGGDASEGTEPYDIALMKFNSAGNLALFATYLGGSGDEQPHSLVVDSRGNLIISGRTTSGNFPLTADPYGTGGGFDIFLAKLSADGRSLLASRKFGGSGTDGVNIAPKYSSSTTGINTTRRNYGDDARSEVITDYLDNIYLASCTQSADFQTSPNAFKTSLGGKQDGVFIKVSSDLINVDMCTLIGGNKEDAAFVLAISNLTGNIFIAGGTASTDMAVRASNAPQGIVRDAYQGGSVDGFITEISADLTNLVQTCYVGTGGADMIYGIQIDKFGYPYIMGTTTSAFPIISSPFNANNNQVSGKQFITKLNPGLSTVVYSANFGKGANVPDISPTAFLVDVCGNVYVSGWGGSGNHEYYPSSNVIGLSLTDNALSRLTDGNDFYFFVLEKNAASQLFGSYFGTNDANAFGDHVDGGTSRFDRRGVIYQAVCANCNKIGIFPTTTGSWSPGNPASTGAKCNEAAVKIAFELSGVISSIRSTINGVPRDSTGCIPLTVNFADTIALGKLYTWDFGDGTGQTTTDPSISHTYNIVGDYRVRLISIDSASCNIADTSYITIRARSNRAQVSMDITKLLPCESFNYQFTNTSVPPPGYDFQTDDFTWDFGDGTRITTNQQVITHQYISSGVYYVKLYLNDSLFCNSPDSAVTQLRVASVLQAQFVTPPTGCAPHDAVFDNTSIGGQNFTWDFGDGSPVSTEASPVHRYLNPGTYTVHLSATDNLTCNPSSEASATITVYERPVSSFTYDPTTPKENTPYVFTNTSQGAVSYKWEFGDGDTLLTTSTLPVSHVYNTQGMYTVHLIAFNQQGCSDTTFVQVEAIVSPLVDVPNAFSPNGDGTNDIIYVQGYGISKITWNIYNRWGQLVFSSFNISTGWDGRYKGNLQPQDVYGYTLNIEYTDGSRYSKKGDITLLR